MSEPLECQDDHRGDCRGEVEFHLRPSDWKAFPRCEHHAPLWLREQERIQQTYGGATPPSWFDPAAAGERWEEDY